jgi:hypothetical protein
MIRSVEQGLDSMVPASTSAPAAVSLSSMSA